MAALKISGGTDGIKIYLEGGRKAGRDFTRDEMDRRMNLSGDLDLTDKIIQSMDSDGEKYLHITIGLKEDQVSPEILKKITYEFERFAFAAYKKDEYNLYSEAHIPRIKSYTDRATGEFIERKPHIHIVVPKINLLTGQRLDPFGMVMRNERAIDAFQERINNLLGLASPKDNRRHSFNNASEMLSRVKGDAFNGQAKDLKGEIVASMVAHEVETYADYQALLATFGEVKTVNAGTDREYFNVKVPGAAKGVNFNGRKAGMAAFTRAFIELPTAEKEQRLAKKIQRKFEDVGVAKRDPEHITQALAEWHATGAREVRYLNSGNKKEWRAYRDASPEDRLRMLDAKEEAFYATLNGENHERAPSNGKGPDAIGRTGRADDIERERDGRSRELLQRDPVQRDKRGRAIDRAGPGRGKAGRDGRDAFDGLSDRHAFGQGEAALRQHAVRDLSSVPVAFDIERTEVLLRSATAVHVDRGLQGLAGDGVRRLRAGAGGRDEERVSTTERPANNVVAQLVRDLAEADEIELQRFSPNLAEIKKNLQASRLMDELSQSHGLVVSKYEIAQAKDGSARILVGKQSMNVSDFLTEHMHLQWTDSEKILRDVYARQIDRQVEQPRRVEPEPAMWQEFKASEAQAAKPRPTKEQRAEERAAERAVKSEQSSAIKRTWYAQRSAAWSNPAFSGTDKRAAVSLAGMQKLQAEKAFRSAAKDEKDVAKAARVPIKERYRSYLHDKAEGGDAAALYELRRMRTEPMLEKVNASGVTGKRLDAKNDPVHQAPALAHKIHRNGDVAYLHGGEPILRDQAPRVQVLREDDAAIETALRLGQQKFGSRLEVTGNTGFQDRAVRVVVNTGMQVTFTDERLNEYMRVEIARREREAAVHAQVHTQVQTQVQEITDQLEPEPGQEEGSEDSASRPS